MCQQSVPFAIEVASVEEKKCDCPLVCLDCGFPVTYEPYEPEPAMCHCRYWDSLTLQAYGRDERDCLWIERD